MISKALLALVRCPECHGRLHGDAACLTCEACGRRYGGSSADFLDLRPTVAFEERTKYLDEALHVDARHEHVSPPLLGSKIRNDMLRAFLAPGPSDVVADLGCGSGRALVWNRDWRASAVGIDITPFFADEARRDVDLLLGDLRRLPFADGTFTKAYSLDVLEHLSPDALRGMLREAARVLAPGGQLFVYTHVRKNAPIAVGLALDQRLRAPPRTGGTDRHAAGAPPQIGSPQSAHGHSRLASRGGGYRIPRGPHPLLHANRRRVRREHPDAHGGEADGQARGEAPLRTAGCCGRRQGSREGSAHVGKGADRDEPADSTWRWARSPPR